MLDKSHNRGANISNICGRQRVTRHACLFNETNYVNDLEQKATITVIISYQLRKIIEAPPGRFKLNGTRNFVYIYRYYYFQ